MDRGTSTDDNDCYQFGFKSGHSTGLCTKTMKNVIDYYSGNGSHVFTCFIDFSKAFDKVNDWKLFHKLLDDVVDCDVVAVLAAWYNKQATRIGWKTTVSGSFSVGNGTRQGGHLSSYFLRVIFVI